MERQVEFREAAASCLDIARNTTDTTVKIRLLSLAQKFMELAQGSASDGVLSTLLDEFNDAQMLKPDVGPNP